MQDYMDAMEPVLQEGKDVFCICLTANFSGSYQSGVNAANILSRSLTPSAKSSFWIVPVSQARRASGL